MSKRERENAINRLHRVHFVGKGAPIPDAFTVYSERIYIYAYVYAPPYPPLFPCTRPRARKFVGDKRCWYIVNHSTPGGRREGRRIVAPL